MQAEWPAIRRSDKISRMMDANRVAWQDRVHFFAVSAQMMRRILVDAARARGSAKRGGRVKRVNHSAAFNLDEIPDVSTGRDRELVAIDDALNTLTELDPRKARLIELRFFGGLSVDETAEILKLSPQSVMRDWKLAKAWSDAGTNKPLSGTSTESFARHRPSRK